MTQNLIRLIENHYLLAIVFALILLHPLMLWLVIIAVAGIVYFYSDRQNATQNWNYVKQYWHSDEGRITRSNYLSNDIGIIIAAVVIYFVLKFILGLFIAVLIMLIALIGLLALIIL